MKMKSLQGDDQDVEDSPDGTGNHVTEEAEDTVAVPPISSAISMNTSSPAYMLPNSRMPWETVLARNSIICIRKLIGYRSG